MGITGQIAATLATSLMGTYSQNSALEAQGAAQVQTARSLVKSMNYSFQNLEQERSGAFESAVEDLTQMRLQALRQQSSVDAAVGEGLMGGGRTANLLSRSVANDAARTAASIKGNYQKKSNEIDLNKESALLNTKSQIESMPKIEKPNPFGTLIGLAGDYYGAKNAAEELDLMRKTAGVSKGTKGKLTGTSIFRDVSTLGVSNEPWVQPAANIFNMESYFKTQKPKKWLDY